MKNQHRFKKSLICSSVLLAIGMNTELALAVDYGSDNNFTMQDPGGGNTGGTNLVDVTWDETFNTDVATAVSNMTISSTVPFFGVQWFAHDVQVFGPGTYVFEACPGPMDPVTFKSADGSTSCVIDGTPQTMVVGPGQVGAHMLFDWNSSINIDVINVWDVNKVWQFGPLNPGGSKIEDNDTSCLLSGKAQDPTAPECDALLREEWLFTATDPDGNGRPGTGMVDGPFRGFNAAFNIRSLGVFEPLNDSVLTIENESVVTPDLMINDSLPGDRSKFGIIAFDAASEKGGSVTDNGDNTYTYLPPVNFNGIDSFAYTVSDGVLSTASPKVEIVVLSEAAGALYTQSAKAAAAGSTAASSDNGSGGVGSVSLLAIPLMLLLSPLRLFFRKK